MFRARLDGALGSGGRSWSSGELSQHPSMPRGEAWGGNFQAKSHSSWSIQRQNSALLTLQLKSKQKPGLNFESLSWFLKLGVEAGFELHSVIVFNGRAPCRHSRRGELHLICISFSAVKEFKGDWFGGILPDNSPGAAPWKHGAPSFCKRISRLLAPWEKRI